MKKILVTLLILVAVVGAVSASDGRIGVSVAPEWYWLDTGTDSKSGQTNLAFMAEGAHYFGKRGSGIGIEYGLGAYFPLNTWVGDADPVKVPDDTPSNFIFKVGAGYRYEFSDLLGLSAGVGMRGKFGTIVDTGLDFGDIFTASGKTTNFRLDIYGDVSLDITLLEFLRINVGVILGGPVYSSFTTKSSSSGIFGDHNNTTTGTIDESGFWPAPVIAVSYTY